MEAYKIKANEDFFTYLLEILNDGGTWGWPNEKEFFIKKGNTFFGTLSGLKKVKDQLKQQQYRIIQLDKMFQNPLNIYIIYLTYIIINFYKNIIYKNSIDEIQ